MRYMDLEGYHIRSIDVGGYRHNYEGFYEKNIISNVYKQGKNDHNSRCSCKPCENSLYSSISLLVKSFEEDIQPSGDRVDTDRG